MTVIQLGTTTKPPPPRIRAWELAPWQIVAGVSALGACAFFGVSFGAGDVGLRLTYLVVAAICGTAAAVACATTEGRTIRQLLGSASAQHDAYVQRLSDLQEVDRLHVSELVALRQQMEQLTEAVDQQRQENVEVMRELGRAREADRERDQMLALAIATANEAHRHTDAVINRLELERAEVTGAITVATRVEINALRSVADRTADRAARGARVELQELLGQERETVAELLEERVLPAIREMAKEVYAQGRVDAMTGHEPMRAQVHHLNKPRSVN